MANLTLEIEFALPIAIAFLKTRLALQGKSIRRLKNKLAGGKPLSRREIRSEFNFEEIVGESPAISAAPSAQVELAAPGETTFP